MDIRLEVDNNSTYIIGRLTGEIYSNFKKELGYLPADSLWMLKSVQEKNPDKEWVKEWDGTITTVCWNYDKCKCSVKKQGTHFPSGLISKALKFFKDNNINVEVKDIRKKVYPTLSLSLSEQFEPRKYQIDVIEKTGKVERGIIQAATASGKTAIGAGIISKRNVSPVIFYVPSIDLLHQTKTELEFFLRNNGKEMEVGEIGAGKKNIQDINVMTVQTAVKCLGGVWKKFDDEEKDEKESVEKNSKEDVRNLIHGAKLIIADEIQHWAAETCQIISDHSINARYKWGVSATPSRDQGDDILIEACFGRKIAQISASKLIREKYLVKPKIFFINISNKRGSKKENYLNVYKEAIVYNEERNNLIKTFAVNMEKSGRNVLVLVKQIAHGKLLEKIIPNSAFIYGEHTTKKRREHLEKMRKGEAGITISSIIFDEGVNVKSLDGLILAGSGKSSTRALQRIGRVLRPYMSPDGKVKKDAMVVDFMDRVKHMESHSRRRLQMYKSEPEFDIEIIKNV